MNKKDVHLEKYRHLQMFMCTITNFSVLIR